MQKPHSSVPRSMMPRSNYAGRLVEFPNVAFGDASAFAHGGRWAAFFRSRCDGAFTGRIILEIGCFDARFLADIAAKYPETGFVGIDWKCKAIYDGAKTISERELRNVVLLRARGQDLIQMFGPAELDEIWVFHPDPCDRPAERKNRLINARFLNHASAVLKNTQSTLTLKTDHEEYYRSVLDLFAGRIVAGEGRTSATGASDVPLNLGAISADYWHDKAAIAHTASRCFAGTKTLFEHRFAKKKTPIFFVEMHKRRPPRAATIGPTPPPSAGHRR